MGLWIALIACIALSGFFSATETAFSASGRIKLKTVEGEQKPRAQLTLKLLEEYDSLLTAVLVGNNLVNIAGTAIATILFTRSLKSEDSGATAATRAPHGEGGRDAPPPETGKSSERDSRSISSPGY